MGILMATDGSQRSVASLLSAGKLLSPANREIDLMYVVPPTADHLRQTHHHRLYRRAHHILDTVRKTLSGEGLSAKTLVRTGSPARILIRASLDYDVTIISAGSHRTGHMEGLGPVASRLSEYGHGATLIAREGHGEPAARILVTVDGSESSLRALDQLVDLIDLSSTEVTLLHVVETPWLHAGPDQEWLGFQEEDEEEIDPQAQLQEEFVREADEILATARKRLPKGTSVNTLVFDGLPADEILGEAERGNYDLVVIGATGAVDLKHRILGSVSSKIAWNAPCSVLLVRAATEKET
jgi:nucleotide-binding universal stress UspA family protein